MAGPAGVWNHTLSHKILKRGYHHEKTVLCFACRRALPGPCRLRGPAASADYTVAIVQQMDHSSLDEIREAVKAGLDALAEEKGITIAYEEFNGQNDTTTLNQIGTQVVSEGYDAIIPIATLAAQCMVNAADGTGIPVIYRRHFRPGRSRGGGLFQRDGHFRMP